MKRAKIMLLTIAVVASVGTALAFKAHKFGFDTYCYLETNSQPADGTCTDIITNTQALPIGTTNYFYTIKPKFVACTNTGLSCPNWGKSWGD